MWAIEFAAAARTAAAKNCVLELQTQGKLTDTVAAAVGAARAGDIAEREAGDVGTGIIQVWMVWQVGKGRLKLQSCLIGHAEVLPETHREVHGSRTHQGSYTGVAKAADRRDVAVELIAGTGGAAGADECRAVKKQVRCWVREVDIRYGIGTLGSA